MKSLVVVFAGVFAAALAGGIGFGVRSAQLRTVHAAADSVAADSVAADSVAADSLATLVAADTGATAGTAPVADSGAVRQLGAADDPEGAARAAAAAESLSLAAAGPTSLTTVANAAGTGDDGAPAIPVRRLARIFGTMQARDAARVLGQLPDADVRQLIGFLNDRQAAAILAQLPPERAAAITGASMRLPQESP